MTREEALNFTLKTVASTDDKVGEIEKIVTTPEMEFLINKIFDDFENRKCENCEYFRNAGGLYFYCLNKKLEQEIDSVDCYISRYNIEISKDFYCKYWESKKEQR